MPYFNNVVPESFCGTERLDKYIASLDDGFNRSKLKSGVSLILLNGNKSKLSAKIKANDVIDIEWEDNIPTDIEPENIPLSIIYEDENVTVVNKVQGMVTHPAAGNWKSTLVNALLFHWGRQSIAQPTDVDIQQTLEARRPGIVHRLDKDTSGVIITAKNRDTEEYLQSQFQNRKVQKEYILITQGHPPAKNGDLKTMIIRDPKNRKRYKALQDTQDGKYSRTLYHCIAFYGNYSLIRVRLKTGRTHQIRVHMKYLNCPIVGDPIYGKVDSLFPNQTLMLHSRQLDLRLPGDENYTRFKACIPPRFFEVMKVLKEKYNKVLPEDYYNGKR